MNIWIYCLTWKAESFSLFALLFGYSLDVICVCLLDVLRVTFRLSCYVLYYQIVAASVSMFVHLLEFLFICFNVCSFVSMFVHLFQCSFMQMFFSRSSEASNTQSKVNDWLIKGKGLLITQEYVYNTVYANLYFHYCWFFMLITSLECNRFVLLLCKESCLTSLYLVTCNSFGLGDPCFLYTCIYCHL